MADKRIAVTLTDSQWGLVLRALEFRYDTAPDDPEYRDSEDVGVAVTHALENAYGEPSPARRARQIREEVERRMSILNDGYSRFSDIDARAVEDVVADIIRQHEASAEMNQERR